MFGLSLDFSVKPLRSSRFLRKTHVLRGPRRSLCQGVRQPLSFEYQRPMEPGYSAVRLKVLFDPADCGLFDLQDRINDR